MATLHVRNVPEGLYQRLKQRANEKGRSINKMAIDVLSESQSLQEPRKKTWAEVVDACKELQSKHKLPPGAKSSVELIREDRESH